MVKGRDPAIIRATVTQVGGGYVELLVDSNTLNYPAIGTQVELWPIEPEAPALRLVEGLGHP